MKILVELILETLIIHLCQYDIVGWGEGVWEGSDWSGGGLGQVQVVEVVDVVETRFVLFLFWVNI